MKKLISFTIIILCVAQVVANILYEKYSVDHEKFKTEAKLVKAEVLEISKRSESQTSFDRSQNRSRTTITTYHTLKLKYNYGSDEITALAESTKKPNYFKGQQIEALIHPDEPYAPKVSGFNFGKGVKLFFQIVAFVIPAFFLFPVLIFTFLFKHTKIGAMINNKAKQATDQYQDALNQSTNNYADLDDQILERQKKRVNFK